MATLIGDGGHAADIAADLSKDGRCVVHVYPHHSDYTGRTSGGLYIGINNPTLRSRVADELDEWDMAWIHRNALVAVGCVVQHGTHINYGVTMTRTTIGHHCTISPGVTICGDVTVGDRTLVGAGATICDRVTIGSDVTIGAGAVVLPETNVPDGETWWGVPAKVAPVRVVVHGAPGV